MRQINHRQQHEDVCLNQRNNKVQTQKHAGSAKRKQRKADQRQQSLASMLA